jgi:phosphoglycerate dehydrogenase-like enzyme
MVVNRQLLIRKTGRIIPMHIRCTALMFLSLTLRSSTVAFCPKRNLASLLGPRTFSAFSATTTANMPQYWNREESMPKTLSKDKPITQQAKIISLSIEDDPANVALHKGDLPEGSSLLAIGATIDEFDIQKLQEEKPNVLFVSHPLARKPLGDLLNALPSIEWVHARSAGIDFVTSDALTEANKRVVITNNKGSFSSTLSEYTMMACSYFAKDLPRLLKQKNNRNWEKYSVKELRGATLGIIGYGDIGRAVARLASAYGMKIVALRRNPEKSPKDPFCDIVYANDKDSMNKLFSESDYVLCSAPLTPETKGMITKEQFDVAKKDACFINVGRGPIVDEDALIDALKTGKIKGAGLDVFAMEPLPESSELWGLDNVLLSP